MAQVITIAGERLFALKAQNNQQLDIDTFIFAFVPGQDSSAPIDRNEGLPPIGQRVHSQIVQQTGLIDENAVVYSSVLDSLTGPFDFNWVGLYSSVNQTLIGIIHTPTVSKTVTVPGAAGNILNRNFVIEYSGIAELTGITVDAETWQLDYTARLNGMDELTRQLAADMNGKDWFIDDGFKVVPRSTLNTFKVTAGVGYVSGLRVTLAADHILTLSSYPQFVYVDAWFDGTSESVWKGHTAFTVTNTEMDDYIDVNGRNHYVFKLARITAADTVEDLRNVDGLAQKIDYLQKIEGHTLINADINKMLGNINSIEQSLQMVITGDSLSFNGFGYPSDWGVNGGGYATDQPFGLMSWAHLIRDFILSSHGAFRPIKYLKWQTDGAPSTVGISKNHGLNLNVVRFNFFTKSTKLILKSNYIGENSLLISTSPSESAVKFTVDGVEHDNLSEDGHYLGYSYKLVSCGTEPLISNVRCYLDESKEGGRLDVYGTIGRGVKIPKLTGKGAWTSGQILDEFEVLVKPYKPDVIFYIIGANDIGQNISVNDFKQNINNFIEKVREYKPNSIIILISTPPTSSYTIEKSEPYLMAMHDLAIKNNLSLIDLVYELGNISPDEYRYDNIHFSKRGDDILFNIIKKRIFNSVPIENNKFIPSREVFLGAYGIDLKRGNSSASFIVQMNDGNPVIIGGSDDNVIKCTKVEYEYVEGVERCKVTLPYGMAFLSSNEIKTPDQLSMDRWEMFVLVGDPVSVLVFFKNRSGVNQPIIGSLDYLQVSVARYENTL